MKRRSTASQTEILELLKTAGGALSHEMIQAELDASVDRATIYRVLNRFCEDGLVHKVVDDEGKQYFAYCAGCDKPNNRHQHNHFHFKCLKCGAVECLQNKVRVPLPEGYVIKDFNGLISGYCSKCS
ncbi:transcriptional repressor [Chitinophaga pendula]|uniref:Fur family transcriptional regulator n=1 Tax=Chitinophaga TaxID=79328 RepID=UPI000BAF6443|nr:MULTISPECIES: transcriptional repressor [Chitinophaga]ASZ12475.1 transcriptional regulator [Chitinophaga sp. MD30]UCJ09924.1 transcriptional repressor [Chitinophaga pendula]